jgi:hypothetical protein
MLGRKLQRGELYTRLCVLLLTDNTKLLQFYKIFWQGSNSDHTSPFAGFWSPKASTPSIFFFSYHQADSEKSQRKDASIVGWKIRVE